MDHVPFARWYEEENITKLQKKNPAFPIDPAAPAQAPAQGALSRQRAHAGRPVPSSTRFWGLRIALFYGNKVLCIFYFLQKLPVNI